MPECENPNAVSGSELFLHVKASPYHALLWRPLQARPGLAPSPLTALQSAIVGSDAAAWSRLTFQRARPAADALF